MKEKDRRPACFILSALNSVFRFVTGGPAAKMNLSGIYYYILCKYDCMCYNHGDCMCCQGFRI